MPWSLVLLALKSLRLHPFRNRDVGVLFQRPTEVVFHSRRLCACQWLDISPRSSCINFYVHRRHGRHRRSIGAARCLDLESAPAAARSSNSVAPGGTRVSATICPPVRAGKKARSIGSERASIRSRPSTGICSRPASGTSPAHATPAPCASPTWWAAGFELIPRDIRSLLDFKLTDGRYCTARNARWRSPIAAVGTAGARKAANWRSVAYAVAVRRFFWEEKFVSIVEFSHCAATTPFRTGGHWGSSRNLPCPHISRWARDSSTFASFYLRHDLPKSTHKGWGAGYPTGAIFKPYSGEGGTGIRRGSARHLRREQESGPDGEAGWPRAFFHAMMGCSK